MPRPMPAPQVEDLLTEMAKEPDKFMDSLLRAQQANVTVAPNGKYRHWDTLRHLQPPEGLSHEEWWLGIKLARQAILRPIPLEDTEGQEFRYCTPDEGLALLHYTDKHASGELILPEDVLEDETARRRYLVNSLIEEAIRSSQLEGATTSRPVAKEMIQTGRLPRDRSERMILNNYRAMQFMHEEMGDSLTPQVVLELQRILTEGTLDNPDAAGRLQTPEDERVAVLDNRGRILHTPPPAELLPARLDALCSFANRETETEGFLHPVVRSILVHFWIGYDHPFEDGNGRTARALFYWAMRIQGYWLTEYLSISKILREAPAKYMRAYLHTETDNGDTTYFILYHLQVIRRAIDEFHEYLRRKIREVREFEGTIRRSEDFNHRQLALLSDAVRHPTRRYTFMSHARSHNVTRQTARTDLLELFRKDLLTRQRVSRQFLFSPAENLPQKLAQPHRG